MKRHIDRIESAVYARGYVYSLHYHLVWVTKYKQKIFSNTLLQDEMNQLLQEAANKNDIVLEKCEVFPDYVHLLLSCKPKLAPTSVVKYLKGYTARTFFSNHPDLKENSFTKGHLWSNNYYIATYGTIQDADINLYVQGQYDGHRTDFFVSH